MATQGLVATSSKTLDEVIGWEVNPQFTREAITILSGNVLPLGSVVQKNAAGKYIKFDGTGTALRILIEAVDASSSDVKATAVARQAIAIKSGLYFGTATTAQITTAIGILEGQGIVVRESV